MEKVLLNKYGEDAYPSPLQTQDGEIGIEGTVIDSQGRPLSGRTVHFRLEDPPDTAPYGVANDDDHPDDNANGPGSLNDAGRTASATSGADGRVAITLHTTRWAAGDNYKVIASTNPSFDCPEGCPKSATYTAWKRVYLENDSMFRKGAFVDGPSVAPAGSHSMYLFTGARE